MEDDSLAEARLAVLAALHQGDAGLAYRVVLGLMGDGYPLGAILERVVAPTQHESGRRWQAGDYSVTEEHVATAAAETLLATLAGAFDHPEGAPHVVVACAAGELHTLPGRMAAALLVAEGYRATFLGSAVPPDDLEAYLADARPAAVVVTCTLVGNLLGAEEVVEAAHRAGVPVIAGGRAFGADGARAAAIGADAWVPTLLGLVDLLGSGPSALEPHGREPEAQPAAGGGPGAWRPEAVDALAAGLGRGVSGPRAERLVADEAARLLDVLHVAARLRDPGLLREHADWLAAYLPTLGIAGTTAPGVLDDLAVALGTDDPATTSLIADAGR